MRKGRGEEHEREGGNSVRTKATFLGIIWVNGTHGTVALALRELEGKRGKRKYETKGEIKATTSKMNEKRGCNGG